MGCNIATWRCAYCQEFIFEQKLWKWWLLKLSVFQQNWDSFVIHNPSLTTCRIAMKLNGVFDYLMEMCILSWFFFFFFFNENCRIEQLDIFFSKIWSHACPLLLLDDCIDGPNVYRFICFWTIYHLALSFLAFFLLKIQNVRKMAPTFLLWFFTQECKKSSNTYNFM